MSFDCRFLPSAAVLVVLGVVALAGCYGSDEGGSDADGATTAPTSGFVDEIGGMSAADLGLSFVEERGDTGSALIIGGRNETRTIAALDSINGISISDLETQMRPGAGGLEGSSSGFLGSSESLVDVLRADNAYVVDELGLTHQELARPLLLLAAFDAHDDGEVVYRGLRFDVETTAFKGSQYSPFHDGTRTNLDVTIRNLDDDLSLGFSLLVPLMVERYGFYEGKGTPYRVEPSEIVELLSLGR